MTQFTVTTAYSLYLQHSGLTRALKELCAPPEGAAPGILAIAIDIRFEAGSTSPEILPPSHVLLRGQNGETSITPWFLTHDYPELLPVLPKLAESFALAYDASDNPLYAHLAQMHRASPYPVNEYSILIGKSCGYVRRLNTAVEEATLRSDIHKTDADIQRFIDSQCRALVPAWGSKQKVLEAATRSAELGAAAFWLHHPQTKDLIVPMPILGKQKDLA